MATIYSSWEDMGRGIPVLGPQAPIDYTINIPPVRRRGQRESIKENIEAAEIAAIMKTISDELTTLSTTMSTFQSTLATQLDDMSAGMEAAKSKTRGE